MIKQTSGEHSGALGRCEQRDGFPVVLVGRALGAGSPDASGEVFTAATRTDPENAPFNVVVHGQGISVWVKAGLDAEVSDAQGGLVPCAHQRPDGVLPFGACTTSARRSHELSRGASPASSLPASPFGNGAGGAIRAPAAC